MSDTYRFKGVVNSDVFKFCTFEEILQIAEDDLFLH